MTCTGEHVVYHCIPNEHNQEVEVCVQWKWISPGYCPYYDSPSKAVKELHCAYYCLQNIKLQETCVCSSRLSVNTSCSEECKQDFSSNTYIFCGYENPSTVVNPSSATSSSIYDYFTHKEERNGTVDSNVNNDNRSTMPIFTKLGTEDPWVKELI
ncbi:uncharacterized protein LOC133196943 [Saccostrea echinata]|uniref:uncharacterized protein LOC133196943 n=1 Tax=Saccostrea echinata TaxID=191078 RepID=UPI002A80B653|nr:uncharacterized protein LOC133196943 [Saccostrea echinata]